MGTFQGLELSKRALFAQQGALYTTGHNIANANTDGYSRQRVQFKASTPFPTASRVMPRSPGQIGTGVDMGVVERVRNKFLDMQFRSENSRHNYWDTKTDALSRLENLLNEPSSSGLAQTMDEFWESLQELSASPENDGARSVVAQRGLAVAETFNHLSKSMQSIQGDLQEEIDVTVKDINSILRQINNLNDQIQKVEPHGMLANDLYDDRDRLIDQLSSQMNIKVHHTASSDSSPEIADGLVAIELVDDSGQSFEEPIYLIEEQDDGTHMVNDLSVTYKDGDDSNKYPPVTGIEVAGSANLGMDLLQPTGSLSALIDSYGYVNEQGETVGDYPETLAELDKMAEQFAQAFNAVHTAGIDANGDEGEAFFKEKDGFAGITAESITVNKDILEDGHLIAASLPDKGSNNGDNAKALAKVFDDAIDDLDDTSPRKFFTTLVGNLGVNTQEAIKMRENTAQLQQQVHHSRMSTSAVSLDEEIANLVKFQHAYNAAARNMTTTDEMIDRIINQMGLVGR